MLQHHLAITNLKQSISQSSAKLQSTGGLTRQTGWAASTEDWGMLPKTRAAFSPQKTDSLFCWTGSRIIFQSQKSWEKLKINSGKVAGELEVRACVTWRKAACTATLSE